MLERGTVVRSLAGRDSNRLLAVMQADEKSVLVCDGKERPIDRPKKKNIRHVEATDIILNEDSLATNRALKKALKEAETEINCNN